MKKEYTAHIKEFLESGLIKFTHISHWLEISHLALPRHMRSWELQPLPNPNSGSLRLLLGCELSTKGSPSLSIVLSCGWTVAAQPGTWKWLLDFEQRWHGYSRAKMSQRQMHALHTWKPDVEDGGATRRKEPGSLNYCLTERLLVITNTHFRLCVQEMNFYCA